MFGSSDREGPASVLFSALTLIIVVGVLLAMVGCGDGGANVAPPPATIIRAGDSPTANATPAVPGQATAAAAQPKVTPPSDAYPSGTGGPYPDKAAPYPGKAAYPSPAK